MVISGPSRAIMYSQHLSKHYSSRQPESALDPLEHVLKARVRLNRSRPDLVGRQHEPVTPSIAQLIGEAVRRPSNVTHVISAGPRSGVKRAARWTSRVLRSAHGRHRSASTCRERVLRCLIRGHSRATVAVRGEDILSVAMNVEIEPDSASIAQLVRERRQALVLRRIILGQPSIRLVARVRRAPARHTPLIGPIPVIIPS